MGGELVLFLFLLLGGKTWKLDLGFKLVFKGDQLKLKLMNLTFPKTTNLGYLFLSYI